jgi:hypothetical protein
MSNNNILNTSTLVETLKLLIKEQRAIIFDSQYLKFKEINEVDNIKVVLDVHYINEININNYFKDEENIKNKIPMILFKVYCYDSLEVNHLLNFNSIFNVKDTILLIWNLSINIPENKDFFEFLDELYTVFYKPAK